MSGFIRREVERANAARNLVLSLGCSEQKAIETIPNIENCQVTPQDVVSSQAIFGQLVSHLKGKSQNVKNAVVPVPQPRRGPQPDQRLHVDLMFIEQEPFLVGIPLPLELKVVEHLKRFSETEGPRAASSVIVVLDNTTRTLKSRGFAITNLFCDGKGVIQKLLPYTNSEEIVVETSPPDNHDSHVEVQIKVIKERVRSIEHSLPYVKCRKLLIACVLYCVSRMNFVSTRNSADNVSPFTKFYNEKVDQAKHLS